MRKISMSFQEAKAGFQNLEGKKKNPNHTSLITNLALRCDTLYVQRKKGTRGMGSKRK